MGAVTFEQDGVAVSGYVAHPEGTPRGGLIVIQEWWGLNDDIRGIADRYASEGFLAFSPDMYHGELSTEPDEARKLAMSMDRDLAALELDAAIAHLKAEHGVAKVGCVGYCMGGGLTLGTAARPTSGIDAGHVYYGAPRLTPDEVASISCR
jgi:carboxymethylenebutenolidase